MTQYRIIRLPSHPFRLPSHPNLILHLNLVQAPYPDRRRSLANIRQHLHCKHTHLPSQWSIEIPAHATSLVHDCAPTAIAAALSQVDRTPLFRRRGPPAAAISLWCDLCRLALRHQLAPRICLLAILSLLRWVLDRRVLPPFFLEHLPLSPYQAANAFSYLLCRLPRRRRR